MTHSKYISAALQGKHADVAKVRSDAHVPTSPPSRTLQGRTPSAAGLLFPEVVYALRKRKEIETVAAAVGVEADAIWLAQRESTNLDSVDAALQQVDAQAERQERYIGALGRLPHPKEYLKKLWIRFWITGELQKSIEALAAVRGEKIDATYRWLLECGVLLAEERQRRYEANVLRQAKRFPLDLKALGAARYLDPESVTLGEAVAMARTGQDVEALREGLRSV